MSHCKDCELWDENGDCWLFSENRPIPENGAGVFVKVSDDHGLTVKIKTGPLFGCVRFRPKPETGN